MAEITPIFNRFDSNNSSQADSVASDALSLGSGSSRSSSPITGWTIKYKITPKKPESKGVWGGYETREEFIAMHFR